MKYRTASDHGIVAWSCLTLEQISGGGITGEARLQYYQINFRENFINSFDNFVCPCQLCAGCRVTRTLFIGVNTAEAQSAHKYETQSSDMNQAGAQIDGCSVAIFLSARRFEMRKGRVMALLARGLGQGLWHGETFYTGISFILEPRFYNKVSLFNLHITAK